MTKKYYRKADKNGNEYYVEEAGVGEQVKGCGEAMSGCGCLLILFVTIPFLLLLFL